MKIFSVAIFFALSASVCIAQNVDVYDGFETPKLGKLWSTDRFEDGAVTMQTNVVRAGHGAAQITVRTGEKFEAGINGNKDSERAELLETKELVSRENVAYEFAFSDFFPTNFPIVPTRLVIAQWKQFCGSDSLPCDDDSPVLKLRYASGKLKIDQTGPQNTTLFETSEDLRGKWTDFKFQIRFTSSTNGFIKGWMNGKQVVDYKGVNAYPENAATGYPSPGYFYFKMGLYRDRMTEPMTIYIDEYYKKQLPDNFSTAP
jgi:Polysaccharide lyase